ncbi:acyl-CoA dehydrogenase family protein [Streptomyces sp. NPDC014734]|uniref:acyl-CoA dehydrogenase family protein n=1 Tax=Streptomyces sp. NPDC014734 TaxID=3364886 RepID=UPI003701BF7E
MRLAGEQEEPRSAVRSLPARYEADTARGPSTEQTGAAAVAKPVRSEAFSVVAGETTQLHGGIGIAGEHDAHRHFKRAHGAGELFGPAARHREPPTAGLGPTARPHTPAGPAPAERP